MRAAALSNDVVRFETMVTKYFDWKLIMLIAKKLTVKKCYLINTIATTCLKT